MSHQTPESTHTPLFPASEQLHPPRPSHHKKRPPSHIPRPPNAFILFRTNFIRDRRLHSSNTGALSNVSPTSLSTIAGLTWRNLPDEEREIWNERARAAREDHRKRYPGYRYQPVPTAEERTQIRETKRKVKEENLTKPDLERCQEISRLLCMGIKGEELERYIAQFDLSRQHSSREIIAPQPTRSSSLPTTTSPPPHAVPRPRSFSTSDASYSGHFASGAEVEYDAIPDTPELLPGSGASHPYEMLTSVAEHALPELAYDSASPASINLPDPQESGYIHSGSSSYADFNLSPQGSSQSLPRTSDHPMAVTNPTHDAQSQAYPSTFSTLATWVHGAQTNEPSYNHFPYFASTRYDTNTNNNSIDTNASSLMNADAHMAFNTHHLVNEAAHHPYASSIPPFELHRKLKPFEQPFSFDFPDFPIGLQSVDAGHSYPVY